MLALSLNDGASAALAALPQRLRARLFETANALATELEAKVRQNLAGEVLNARSGALLRSIAAAVAETQTGVEAVIATSRDVKYAAIQEFGGTIPPHQIVPDKARALAFLIGGKRVFATRAQIPQTTMPERSYMRSSLADMAEAIHETFSEAAAP